MPGVGYCPQAELAALCRSKTSPGGVASRVRRPRGRYAGSCVTSPSPPLGPDTRFSMNDGAPCRQVHAETGVGL